MKRVALIVKYFPPDKKRVSGLTSFACVLFERLAMKVELHVFSKCSEKSAKEWSEQHPYTLHPVGTPFWIKAGGELDKVSPDCIIILSGIHKAFLLYPAFRFFFLMLRGRPAIYFYQCVNLDGPPGWLARGLLARFSRLIGASPSVSSYLSSIAPSRSIYVPPGIDLERISAAPVALKGAHIRIGYFNHLNKIKGCDIALDSFLSCQFTDAEYIIAGTGKMADLLKNNFDGKNGIRFLGSLSDPIPDMKACDMILLPFRTHVTVLGISQTVLECLASGVPVIGSDNEAITAVIRDGKEGLIYYHTDQICDKIRLLHDNAELRKHLSKNAALRSKEFGIEKASDKLYNLIKEDLGQ